MKTLNAAASIVLLALFAAHRAAAALPDGYVELRAIQGDGTAAYIATGYIPKPNIDRIEAKFRIDVRTGANSTLFCSRIVTTAAINAWTIFSNLTTLGMRFDYLNNKDNFKTGFTNGQMVELSVSSNVVTFADGSTLVSGNPYDPDFTEAGSQMFLFGSNQDASTAVSNWSKDILYSFKVYRNDVLIHDYVPAKRSSDGKIGLYDVVDGIFLANANSSGAFTAIYAEPFHLKGSDAGSTSSMSGLGSCAGWTNAVGAARTAAVAYEDYVVDNGFTIREPAVNYDYTFPGASLTVVKGVVNHGGEAGKKLTIGDLRVPEGGACNFSRAGSSRNLAWGGNYSIAEGGVLTFLLFDDKTNSVSASVSGSGILRFEVYADGRGTQFLDVLTGDLSSFTGSIEICRPSVLEFASAASIPGDPPAGTTSSVVVTNGATLVVDYDWTSPTNRVWDFGDGARPTIYVAEGKTLTINGEITGSAGFRKTGAGTLVLAPGGDFGCIWLDGEFAATRSAPAEPEVVVTNMVAGGLLVKGADYDVVYSNHLVSSTGYAIVAGKGTYAGREVVLPYSIDHKLSARDFRYCMTVAPTSGKVTTTLANFPVLLRLSAARQSGFDPAACGTGGSNLRVALSDGTLLAHEIDYWDAEGESTVWVNVPSLASDTVFYVLWSPDGGYTPPAFDPSETWPDYVGVWHMNLDGNKVYDSSANGYTATNISPDSVSAAASPKVGQAAFATNFFLTAATDLLSANAAKPISNRSKVTFSGWLAVDSAARSDYGSTFAIYSKYGGWYDNCGGANVAYLPDYVNDSGFNSAIVQVFLNSGTGYSDVVNTYPTGSKVASRRQTWVYLTVSLDGTTKAYYFDGAQTGTETAAHGILGPDSTARLKFGPNNKTTGRSDEIRIRDGVASAAWILADYRNMATQDFVSYGEVKKWRPGSVYYIR